MRPHVADVLPPHVTPVQAKCEQVPTCRIVRALAAKVGISSVKATGVKLLAGSAHGLDLSLAKGPIQCVQVQRVSLQAVDHAPGGSVSAAKLLLTALFSVLGLTPASAVAVLELQVSSLAFAVCCVLLRKDRYCVCRCLWLNAVPVVRRV